MEGNRWRPTVAAQGEPTAVDAASEDWRSQLHPEARQRIVNMIMDSLKKVAVQFEQKIYTAASNQSDYLRTIYAKMLSIETKIQGAAAINPPPSNPAVGNPNPADSAASLGMQPQVGNQGQSLAMPLVNQSQVRQQLLPQTLQNNSVFTALQGSALPSISGLNQSTISNAGQSMSRQQHVQPTIHQQSMSRQQHENHVNQAQQMNLQGSVASMQSTALSCMQQETIQRNTQQQNMANALQPANNFDAIQGISFSSLQQGAIGSVQQGSLGSLQNTISVPQQTNINTLSQSSGNTLQSNANSLPPGSNLLQHQHLKQHQQEQHQQKIIAPPQAQSHAVVTPGISASPLLAEFTSPDGSQANVSTTIQGKPSATERPLECLVKAVQSLSSKALSSSIDDIGSVSMIDRIAGSAPGNSSRAAVGEDLVAMTKCRLQARSFISQDGSATTKKMKRHTSAMPLNAVSSAGSVSDSFKRAYSLATSELESTATSNIKMQKIEVNHALMEEIREINQQLIDTVVSISDEDVDSIAASAGSSEGTVVKFSFCAVSLSPSLKAQFASGQMSPIMPLRLVVSANYPKCSPILVDKLPIDASKEYEDLSTKAQARFNVSLRCLSQPMSLGEMAREWDVCARRVIEEYARQSGGGGSFSSRYGAWENCVSA